MCQVKNHPNKDALIADVQYNRTYNPFSEKSKQMIHNVGNVECFELCEISSNIQCSSCRKYWAEGIVYCTCGTSLIPTDLTGRLTEERFDALTIPHIVIKKGNTRWCSSREKRSTTLVLPSEGLLKKRYNTTIVTQSSSGSNQQSETYTESQQAIGWDGGAGSMKARLDYSDAVRTICDLRHKDDQKAHPPLSHPPTISPTSSTGNQWRWNSWFSSGSSSTDWRGSSTWWSSPKMGRTSVFFLQGLRFQEIAFPL